MADTAVYRDHLDREVVVPMRPQRIVSLCPSLTETLFALGLGPRMVGRTRHCVHPDAARTLQNVGGTKEVRADVIATLEPDLIFCEKEENTEEIVRTLSALYPVYVVDVHTVDDALGLITDLGEVTGVAQTAQSLRADIKSRLQTLPRVDGVRMAYLIWQNPYMGAGQDTYLDALFAEAGYVNALADLNGRYPEVTLEVLQHKAPDVVFLSSEPYPFKASHQAQIQAALPQSKVLLIDGEVCWSGARMREAVAILRKAHAEWTRFCGALERRPPEVT
ncbi:MAG: helical backbone metal receptor [Firmicutes bacterium]|nr:helical backbone metal receptor [Bacillota bacterium]